MPLYTSTGALNVALSDTTGTGRYSASGALRINLVSGTAYVGLYAADGSMNVVDVTGVSISTYGGLYHPSGAIRGRTAPTTLSGLQAPDGSYYFLGLFSPLNLFSAGEQGAWYDPSDFTTMFQDSVGTTPVTAVEQPVGLILDKSKGLALGSELVTNGTFDTNTTGWTLWQTGILSVDNFRLKVENGAATISGAYQLITVVVGRTYKFEGVKEAGTALSPRYYLGTSVGGTQYASNATSGQVFIATSTTLVVTAATQSTVLGATAFFDNISVRELPGNHASQSTSASRPVLSARVNQLTYTEDFSNAAWVAANSGTAAVGVKTNNFGTAPDGSTTAARIQLDVSAGSVGNQSQVYQYPPVTVGAAHTYSAWIRTNDSSTKVIQAFTAGAASPQTITVTGTWTRFTTSRTPSSNPDAFQFILVKGTTSDTADLLVWHPDVRVTNDGVGIPAYQRVAAATDYDTSGFPLYLRFDGTDDSLSTASIDFSATDKMSVFSGVRKLSDAAGGNIVSLGNVTSVNGSFELRAPRAAAPNYMFASRGTSFADANIASGYSAPITNVVTGIADISADLCALRINGTVVASPTTDQGTGNYSSAVVFVGRLGGTALSFNGRLYSLIVRGAQSTTAQIASTEAWVNGKTGAY
jgi:hypothetical protein